MMRLLYFLGTALASDVVTLTDSTFEEFIKANDKVLVKFYAPWCGHCKKMAPEFEKAATELKGTVPLADVDSTVEKDVSSKYGVSGYPTLKWFVNGEAQEYGGGRDSEKIIEWIKSMSAPAVSLAPASAPTGKPVVIATFPTLPEVFEKFADKNRQNAVFHYKEGADATVTLQHENEEIQKLTDGAADADKLAKFFADNKAPLVGVLNGDTYGDYVSGGNGLIWCLWKHDEGKLSEAKTENYAIMKKIAEAVKGKFSVTYTDTIEFKQAIEGMLGVTEFPALVIQKKAGSKHKFVFDGDLTDSAAVIQYVNDVADGKIQAKLKSEEVPETQGAVKVVVGTTLKEIVYSKTKDVLFEVYAPWCGHCKKLDPEYELVAKKVVKEIDDLITIAKMDGTANDSPTEDIEWSGFPTLVWIKAGTTEVVPYEGGRTAKDIWAFIRENSTHKEEISKRLKEKYESEDLHDEL